MKTPSRPRLRDLRISQKLALASLSLCLLLVSVGAISYWAIDQLNARIGTLSSQNMPKITRLSQVRQSLRSTRGDLSQAILEPDLQVALRDLAQVNEDELYLLGAVTHYQSLAQSAAETKGVHVFQQALYPWLDTLHTIEPLAQVHSAANQQQIITILDTQWLPEADTVDATLGHLIDLSQQQADASRQAGQTASAQLGLLTTVVILLAFVLALALSMMLARLIGRPLRAVVEVAQQVARGEMVETTDLVRKYGGRDETGQLIHAFHGMIEDLRGLFSKVRQTNQNIASVSGQRSKASEDDLRETTHTNGSHNQLTQAVADIQEVEQLSTQLAQAYQELAEAHATIQQQALTDPLTGLPNHRALVEQLDQELERSHRYHRPFALLFFDGDHFKRVNDTYGHAIGDLVLHQLGERARSALRGGDVIARYGGEEFVALLPEADTEQAAEIAERMRLAIVSHPLVTDQVPGGICATVSMGIARFPEDGTTAQALLVGADQAMYWAKKLGRNQVRTISEAQRASQDLLAVMSASDDDRERDSVSRPNASPDPMHTIYSLMGLIELRDPHISAHSHAVSELAASIAHVLHLDEPMCARVSRAALLHDIGKISIPDAILNKPGSLSESERYLMRQHSLMGAQIVEVCPDLCELIPAIRHHHERWDGSGYPDGLAGELIPLEARVIAIAEAYDAMTRTSVYQVARTIQEARTEVQRRAGTQFDPAMVQALMTALAKDSVAPQAA